MFSFSENLIPIEKIVLTNYKLDLGDKIIWRRIKYFRKTCFNLKKNPMIFFSKKKINFPLFVLSETTFSAKALNTSLLVCFFLTIIWIKVHKERSRSLQNRLISKRWSALRYHGSLSLRWKIRLLEKTPIRFQSLRIHHLQVRKFNLKLKPQNMSIIQK